MENNVARNLIHEIFDSSSEPPSPAIVVTFVTLLVTFLQNVLYKEINIFSNSHTKSICGIKN